MTNLSKKVHSFNEVQRIGFLQAKSSIDQLKPYVGQKIFKVDNAFLQKVSVKFEDIQPTKNPTFTDDYISIQRCYLDTQYSSIWLKITIYTKDTDHSCFYTDHLVYIGTRENQILTKVEENLPEPIQTTVERQIFLQKEIGSLEEKLRNYKHELI